MGYWGSSALRTLVKDNIETYILNNGIQDLITVIPCAISKYNTRFTNTIVRHAMIEKQMLFHNRNLASRDSLVCAIVAMLRISRFATK